MATNNSVNNIYVKKGTLSTSDGITFWDNTNQDLDSDSSFLFDKTNKRVMVGSSNVGSLAPGFSATVPWLYSGNNSDPALATFAWGLFYSSVDNTLSIQRKNSSTSWETSPVFSLSQTTGHLGLGQAAGSNLLHGRIDQNSSTSFVVQNASTGNAAYASKRIVSDAATLEIFSFGSGYTTSGPFVASGSAIAATGSGGLALVANNASGSIPFYAGGLTFRGILSSSGNLGVGPLTSPVARVHLSRSSGVTTNTVAGAYMHFGSGEALSGTRQILGFGYSLGGTYIRAGLGWIGESDSGQTLGRLSVFQSPTSADNSPPEIWSWDRSGNYTCFNTASAPGTPSGGFTGYSSNGRPLFIGADGIIRAVTIKRVWEAASNGTVTTTGYNQDTAYTPSITKINTGVYPYVMAGAMPFSKYFVNFTALENKSVTWRVDITSTTTFNVYVYDSNTKVAVDCAHQIEVQS
jgi:hypothetical protein